MKTSLYHLQLNISDAKKSLLFYTPKVFPEYKQGYYAIFFEDPDRIKLEVVYIP